MVFQGFGQVGPLAPQGLDGFLPGQDRLIHGESSQLCLEPGDLLRLNLLILANPIQFLIDPLQALHSVHRKILGELQIGGLLLGPVPVHPGEPGLLQPVNPPQALAEAPGLLPVGVDPGLQMFPLLLALGIGGGLALELPETMFNSFQIIKEQIDPLGAAPFFQEGFRFFVQALHNLGHRGAPQPGPRRQQAAAHPFLGQHPQPLQFF